MRHITWLGLLVGATAVGGTAYKSVGPDGTVIFSDRPMPKRRRSPVAATLDLRASGAAGGRAPESGKAAGEG